MTRTVYVPNPTVANLGISHILVGSAIVSDGVEDSESRIVIDYEGNRYGAQNLTRFAQRVLVAAERQASAYPTVARMSVGAWHLTPVGEWTGREVRLIPQGAVDLAAWLNVETLSCAELVL